MPLNFSEDAVTPQIDAGTAVRDAIAPPAASVVEPNPEALALEVSAAARRRKRAVIRGSAWTIACACIISLLGLAVVWLSPDRHLTILPLLLCYAASLVVCIGSAFRIRGSKQERQNLRDKVQQLAYANSSASTGALIDVLGVTDRHAGRIAAKALTRSAFQWTEEDVAAMTRDQRSRLRQSLLGIQYGVFTYPAYRGTNGPRNGDDGSSDAAYWEEHADFRIALCAALARTGSSEDLRTIRRVAMFPAATPATRRVRAAAQQAAPILEARLAEMNRPHVLLRASTQPPAPNDELLRAAADAAATPPDELLRSAPDSSGPSRT